MKKNYFLPGICECFKLNMALLMVKSNNEDKFYQDINIAGVFGTFPNAIWNGGRLILSDENADAELIQSTLNCYHSYDLVTRFTFTNTLINQEHLNDLYCNLITTLAGLLGNSEIIISSEILENYFKGTYPTLPLIASITKGISKEDYINWLEKDDYKTIVLPPSLNHDIDFLNQIPKELRNKVEILVNCGCLHNCPNKAKHYAAIAKSQLEGVPSDSNQDFCGHNNDFFTDKDNEKDFITLEEVDELFELGYNNFKIEGREAWNSYPKTLSVLEAYLYYLVKPEYKDEVRYQILTILGPLT